MHTPHPTPNHPGCPGQYGRPHWPGGCRCLVDAAPTHALIRSLAAIGWPLREQGRLLGKRYGRNFRALTRDRIERGTAMQVGWLYARLWDVPGPSTRAVATAARLGWNAPDPVVVARLAAGIDCPHTRTDRDQAVRVLLAAGRLPVAAIAARLHISADTVRGIHRRGGWEPAPTSTLAALARLTPARHRPARLSGKDTTIVMPALTPDRTLGATRTSHRWAQPPGNFDKLNCRALWPSDNQWGIPALPPAWFEPARLVAYTDRHAITTAAPNSAVHFFLDDYRFETVWSKPERGLSRCRLVGAALTPDFSLWTDMPLAMQLWQVYRSRWCGAWLLHHGIQVVPTVSWSTPDSFEFAFAGIPTGSVVAVSTVGVVRDRQARTLFSAGYAAMLDRLQPATVLVYGHAPTEHVPAGTTVRCYTARWGGR